VQFHLGLAAAVVLATDADLRPAMRVFRLALLALAPLSGPPAIILLPLFAARALVDRSAARGLEFAVLALGAGLQIALFAGGTELAPDYLQVLHAERYSYMPNALLPMALVAMLPYVTGPLARGLIRLGLWMAVLSLVGLTVPVETFARGPDWRAEVAAYRLDP